MKVQAAEIALRRMKSEHDRALDDSKAQLAATESNLSRMKDVSEQKDKAIARLEDTSRSLADKVNATEANAVTKQRDDAAAIKAMEMKVDAAKHEARLEVNRLQADHQREKRMLQSELDALKSSQVGIQSDTENLRQRLQRTEDDLRKAQSESDSNLAQVRDGMKALQEAREDFERQRLVLKQQHDVALREADDEFAKRAEALRKEKDQVSMECAELTNQSLSMKKELELLNQALKDAIALSKSSTMR